MSDGDDAGDGGPPREPPSVDEADRLVANTEVHTNAWEQTIEELRALEDDYEAEGWDVIATIAGHTGPVAPVHDKGYWGLSYIVPDSDAERIREVVETHEFPTYDVLRNHVQGRVFAIVSYLDADSETAILVGSNFELRRATELVLHARDVGHLNTLVRHLDGRIVAEFHHEEPEKFFPRYESFETSEGDWVTTAEMGDPDRK